MSELLDDESLQFADDAGEPGDRDHQRLDCKNRRKGREILLQVAVYGGCEAAAGVVIKET